MLRINRWLRAHRLLLFVFLLAIFFRYFRPLDFQFWSTDEEIIAHFVRKIVDEKRLFLISPNFSLGISLGSAFYLLSSIPYSLTNLNPIYALWITTLCSLVTVATLYVIGKAIRSSRLGLLAATFYSASFLISLNDRRWWTLTITPLFTSLTIFALLKLLQKQYRYFTLLAICVITAWQIDPNLGILPMIALLAFFTFRMPYFRKEYIPGWLVILISIFPLFFFELRHPGAIVNPLVKKISETEITQKGNYVSTFGQLSTFIVRVPAVYAGYFALVPDQNMDAIFNWVKDPTIVHSPLPQIVFLWLISVTAVWLWQNRGRRSQTRSGIILVWISFASFLASLFISRSIFGLQWRTYYFHVSVPIICVLLAFGVELMYQRQKFITIIFLLLFVLTNFWTLLFSDFRYPLQNKWELVHQLKTQVTSTPFRLKTIAEGDFRNHGFSGLFVLARVSPHKSDEYDYLDWWMRAHSLYFINPDMPAPHYSVIISARPSNFPQKNIEFTTQVGSMYGIVYNSLK